jgi:formate hydrogenlyase subunit 6/NADH:ubiquinone oxidoreductase subunit I
MKIGVMFGDVANALFRKPVTERYPFERNEAPERFRGQLIWKQENCTGCGLCAMDCPAQAIEMIVIDKKAKRFVLRYHVDRCTFCAQCVYSCRQGSLEMSSEIWEMAALNKDAFTIYSGEEQDIAVVLSGECADT